MRIAFTHTFSWPEVLRGGERFLHELSAALRRRGHDVRVFAGAGQGEDSIEDGVRIRRIRRGPVTDPGADRRFAARVLPHLLFGRFDVVHSLGPRDAVASIRARSLHPSRRTVYTNLGNPVRAWWETLPDCKAHERVVRDVDVYGCMSHHALRCLRDDYGREGALTPGGVRTEVFRPLGAKEDRPTILYSGVLDEPRKGVSVLLRALPRIARSEPGVRLWLSGSGDARPLLDSAPAEARERTEVLGPGRPDEMAARYSAAWVTVLPSWDEAFGISLVESLACGTPIVGADHAALPELVGPGLGALAQPRDVRGLADACGEALALAAEPRCAERCRDAARAHDWDEAVAPAVEAIYESAR